MTTPDTITESQTQNFPHLCWSCSLHQGHPALWVCKPSDATASAPDTRVRAGQQTQGQRSPRRPRSCQDSALLRLKARLQQQEKTMDPIGKHLGTEAQELASGSSTNIETYYWVAPTAIYTFLPLPGHLPLCSV